MKTGVFRLTWNCYFGIIIGEKNTQGKGYGKITMNLITKYTFNTLNLKKIILEVVESNEPAINLYKNLGFVTEGKLKKQYFADGKYYDVFVMSLFKDFV